MHLLRGLIIYIIKMRGKYDHIPTKVCYPVHNNCHLFRLFNLKSKVFNLFPLNTTIMLHESFLSNSRIGISSSQMY